MFTSILAGIVAALNALPEAVGLFKDWLAWDKEKTRVAWQVALQTGISPLEQPNQDNVTDVQRAAAAKAFSDAIARLPS